MYSIEESELAGIGQRFEVTTDAGDRLVLVVHDSGTVETYCARAGEQREPSLVVTLKEDEARLVAAIIGRTIYRPEAVERLKRHGIGIVWCHLKADSYGVGKSIGELLEKSGVTILSAVDRDGKQHTVPPPGFVLQEGCQLALAGVQNEVQALRALLGKSR